MFKSYEEIFKNLREMQDQFWQTSTQSFPDFGFTRELNAWQRKTLEDMSTWAERAVKQSFDLQREWLEQWAARATGKDVKPKLFADLSAEAQNSMQRWLDNQNQLWDQWLQVLRAGGGGAGSLPSFGEWQKATEESVQRQMALMQEWLGLVDFKKLSPKEIGKLSDQIVKAMEKSVETQQKLWGQWFEQLSDSTLAAAALGGAPTTKAPARRKKAAAIAEAPAAGATQPSDDLKQISGIGPAIEKQLKDHGISTLRQIASFTDEDIASLEGSIIRFPGRIKRERWVEQAKELLS